MTITMSTLYIFAGIILLYSGGEFLVRGSTFLARTFGISPLVIGLTVVALGTSSPELAAVLVAVIKGEFDVALGGIVGSNISNLGLILGVACLIYPLQAASLFIRREVPFMIFTSALLLPLVWDSHIVRYEGLVLIILLIVFIVVMIRQSQTDRETAIFSSEIPDGRMNLPLAIVGVIFGIAFLAGGAHLLVEGAIRLANYYGVPQKVIGLTLVAFGTSLPEFASCTVAAFRRESDMVLGNVIGSNILNVLCILGISSVVKPVSVAYETIVTDIIIMLGFSLLIMPFLVIRLKLNRLEGGIMLILYFGYIYYLFAGAA